ncbi:MAG: IS1096 element passenger TnpR family protein [Bacteroidales bacterium]
MHIYRFKVKTDTIDEYVREIDITPTHTFEDFQKAILECAPLRAEAQMWFYIANARWVKLREIAEKPLLSKTVHEEDEDIRVENRRINIPFTHIAVARLRDYIMDPHQKIIFEYNGVDSFVFFIELQKIYQADDVAGLPKCVNAEGEIPLKPIELIQEIEIRRFERKDKEKNKQRKSLDEISDEEIAMEIEKLEDDETFGAIIKGEDVPAPAPEKKKKLTREEIAEQFGPEFAEIYDPGDSDLEEEELPADDDDFFFEEEDDEDDFRSGGRGRGGRGYDEDDY